MKTDYDVIIVGAGPAGASCAKFLIENNIKTLIIEKNKLSHNKPCGGLLSNRSMKFLKDTFKSIPESIICKNKELELNISRTGKSFITLPESKMLKTYRSKFIEWLINESKAGIIELCRFKKYNIEDKIITVNAKLKNKDIKIKCKYLIGADGCKSLVRKMIDINYQYVNFLYAHQVIYNCLSDINKYYCYYITGRKYSQYLAWFFCEDDLIYIGTTYSPKTKINYFFNLIQKLKEEYNFQDKNIIKKGGGFVDVRSNNERFYFGGKNILLIGEASGMIYYLSDGISPALITGKKAALTIINNFGTKDLCFFYEKEIKKEKEVIFNSWIYKNS